MGALGNLVPLVILFAFISAVGWFGYQVYLYSNDLATKGKESLDKRNISFSKGGMKVKVKDVSAEDYEDRTQSVLVKTWSLANEGKSSSRSSSRTPNPSRENSGTGKAKR